MKKMGKLFLTGCFSLAMAAAFVAKPVMAVAEEKLKEGEKFKLTILQTNDFHGHLDDIVTLVDGTVHHNSVARYATIIENVRNEEENVLLVDGGDVFLRGEFQEGQGELETSLLKALDYDAMALGNNDFRVYPAGEGTPDSRYEQLKNYHRNVNFPILTGNVIDRETGKYIQNVKPWKSFAFTGVKVGMIGLTSMKPEIRGWDDVADLDFIEPVEALNALLPEVSEKSDVNIVLSHAGNPEDHKLAQVPGVSAVIGADTHKVIETPEYEFNGEVMVPITQAGGEQEHYLGRLNLTFEVVDAKMTLVESDGFLYDVTNVPADPEIQAIIDDYRADLKAHMTITI
ncbi:bifunctional metallophosphatase/5'-nucleotidase [Peribacillus frigoritolerans]|uniref:bifunctional metallophosphatase/5'-nucleotidase n=1 Tax=Peribacillus frigoritolerans TaxID=450367 RepID=UPI0023DCC435|nr:metallophosphoesterase [Peribacillus frigoritolerans]MDF1995851.1 metallophosphoesterase [Peribacillus frigoritolerans]